MPERVGLQTYWRQREFLLRRNLWPRYVSCVGLIERCRLPVPKFFWINFCHLANAVAERCHRNASDRRLATMRFGEASGSLPLTNGLFLSGEAVKRFSRVTARSYFGMLKV